MEHTPTESIPESAATTPNKIVIATQPVAKTVRGQKYHAPIGRHSQQSHRRAQERADAGGHGTSKEQHDHDRSAIKAEVERLAALKVRQVDNKPK